MARLNSVADAGSAWPEVKRLEAWAYLWYEWSGSAFLHAYLTTAAAGTFLPPTREEVRIVLEHCLLATGVAALHEALTTRPRWTWIAIDGLLHFVQAE